MVKAKHWSAKEIEMLKKHYPTAMPVDELATLMGRSKKSVVNHASQLGISRRAALQAWSEDEVQTLKAMFTANHRLADIAGHIGRTVASISCKVTDLGLKREPITRPVTWWSHEENRKLKELWHQGCSIQLISHKLRRSCGSVKARAKMFGLSTSGSRGLGINRSHPTKAASPKAIAAAQKYAAKLFAPADHSPEAREARMAVRKALHAKAQRNWVQDMFRGCEIPESTLKRLGLSH